MEQEQVFGDPGTALPPEVADFRSAAHAAVDWVADYLGNPDRYPVLSRVQPGWLKTRLPNVPPASPVSLQDMLGDIDRLIIPGITHWNHPRFFAYFAITGSVPGIIGELLAAALNVNGMLWRTSPAATELEEVVMDWLRQMLGLPMDFRGIIMDTASTASLTAMAAAREAAPGLSVREQGLQGGPELCVYASSEAHSSIEKAAIVLGIGQKHFRKIPTDDEFRMDVRALQEAIQRDRAQGCLPVCVVATVGTTSTTAIDPVGPIARVCREERVWLHVDAAYGGAAAIIPENRWVLDGCDQADSVVVNPHKWLATPIDCSALFFRHPEVFRRAFSLVPEYLKTDELVTNFMDFGIQLGRRFRALKLWMVLQYFGWEGMAEVLRRHMGWARAFGAWVDAERDFERLAPIPFSTVCFRFCPREWSNDAAMDHLNQRLVDRVNGEGRIFLSTTRIRGRLALRLAIGNYRTRFEDVAEAWNVIRDSGRAIQGERAAEENDAGSWKTR